MLLLKINSKPEWCHDISWRHLTLFPKDEYSYHDTQLSNINKIDINRLFADCKGGNFNIHIWA